MDEYSGPYNPERDAYERKGVPFPPQAANVEWENRMLIEVAAALVAAGEGKFKDIRINERGISFTYTHYAFAVRLDSV
jgi:hypothetical protein